MQGSGETHMHCIMETEILLLFSLTKGHCLAKAWFIDCMPKDVKVILYCHSLGDHEVVQ
jgi:hypothetical protein